MRSEESWAELKDGRRASLRAPREDDAPALLEYLRRCAAESENLQRQPDEITQTPDDERAFVRRLNESERDFGMMAFVEGELAGFSTVNAISQSRKIRHRAEVSIALLKPYWGVGLGTALLNRMIEQARALGFEQLELQVVSSNQPAVALYRKLGFAHCGRLPHAQKLPGGTYQDYDAMILFL
ncbi:MAG: GNAT family N-acetyltransferase [Eubacteriales bacterium]|nr:GNAT family N-acetyltransferase [Eubacteriales bacterium]